MWLFGAKARLVRALDKLATYNDKGIYWSKHEPEQVAAARAAYIAKVMSLAAQVGVNNLPAALVSAFESGALATDGTGKYVVAVKAHFRHRSNAL